MAATEVGSSSSSLIENSWEPVLDPYLRKKAEAKRDLKEPIFSKTLSQKVLSIYKDHYSSRPEWVLRVASHLYQYSKLDLKQTWLQSLLACEMVHDHTCFGESLETDDGIIIQSKRGAPLTVEYTQKSSVIYVHLSHRKTLLHVRASASSLGKGASGEVAIQLQVTKDGCQLVANKQMLLSERCKFLPQREHGILKQLLGFPYIVAPFDLICHKSSTSLTMELANQGPIAWKKIKHFPLRQRLELFQQALTALTAVHKLHLAHTDLKPANLLLTKYTNTSGKERYEVRLIDFAYAVDLKENETRQLPLRSPYYQPMEVHRKETLDRAGWQRADVFALGIIGIQEILGSNSDPYDGLTELIPATQANTHPDTSLFWKGRKHLPGPMRLVFDGMLANSSKNRLTAQVALDALHVAMEKID